VQVVEQRHLVIEKFRIHRPAAVAGHQLVADQIAAEHVHGLAQREFPGRIAVERQYVAHALVGGGQRTVHRGDDRRKPAFLDRAALGSQRIIIVGVEPQAETCTAETPRHEDRHQAEDAPALFECLFDFHIK